MTTTHQAHADVHDETDLRRLADELFICTDSKDWATARALDLIAGFRAGLHPGKVNHHLAANYRIRVTGGTAAVWIHGYAVNHVPALPAGANLWETWGTYHLTGRKVSGHWLLDGFRYHSKLTRGDEAVRTHQP